MAGGLTQTQKIQKRKCYQKQIVLNKANDLVRHSNLKVIVAVYDPQNDSYLEFKSHKANNTEWVWAIKMARHNHPVGFKTLSLKRRKCTKKIMRNEEISLD